MSDELILIEKDGEKIRVHPDALTDHQRLGWTVVEPPAEKPAVEPTETPKARNKPAVSRA